MSALETMNRTKFKEAVEVGIVEVAVYNWINEILDSLRRQLQRNQIAPDRASKIWKIKRGCYDCCSRALKEGRLP
jgi:hypothetical protein